MSGYRLASIPGLLALVVAVVVAVAFPGASAAKPRAHRAHAHRTKARTKAVGNPSCGDVDTPASGASGAAMDSSVLCLINQQRSAHHLPTLHEDSRLDHAAQSWTNTMVQTHSFWHGTNLGGRIDAVGYSWSAAGENVGTGYATPRQIVTAWMASPDHCRNILNPEYADVGTGVLARGIAPYGPSTWTQDFGLLVGRTARSHNAGPMNACP